MSLSLARPVAANAVLSSVVASRFSRAAKRYDDFASVQHQIADAAIAATAWRPDDCVLDIGAGTGCNTQKISTRVASAMGVDLSCGMVETATARYPSLTFVEGDAQALPFADAQFSKVFSSMALQWCPSPRKVLDEITRVLKPGGKAVLAIMVEGSFDELATAQRTAGLCNTLMPLPGSDGWLSHCQNSALTLDCSQLVRYTEEFCDLLSLLRSINRVGASTTANSARAMTRRDFRQLEQVYERAVKGQAGLPLSYQVLHVQLEKP